MRKTFRMIDGQLTEVMRARSEPRAPAVISDYHEPFVSQADGRTYDSKCVYRASLKAAGYEELGSDRMNLTNRPDRHPDGRGIEAAVADACRRVGL